MINQMINSNDLSIHNIHIQMINQMNNQMNNQMINQMIIHMIIMK